MYASKKLWNGLFVLVLIASLLIACTGASENGGATNDGAAPTQEQPATQAVPQGDAAPSEPVTVTIAFPWGEELFNNRFHEIDEKLPDVDIQFAPFDHSRGNEALQEMFAAGINPDIIVTLFPQQLVDLDIIYPLDDIVQAQNFDLDSLNPGLISFVRSFDPEGRLIGFPDGTGYIGLYYNKEVFDKFGVPYPESKMTWDEAIELARLMTKVLDGQPYVGLEFGGGFSTDWELAFAPLRERAVNATDPETGEVLITQEPAFTEFLELMKKFYSIPGIFGDGQEQGSRFIHKTAAMAVHWHGLFDPSWGDLFITRRTWTYCRFRCGRISRIPVPTWQRRR